MCAWAGRFALLALKSSESWRKEQSLHESEAMAAAISTLSAHSVSALRRELAQAERHLRVHAEREARRLAEAEHVVWREAQDACTAYDCIRQNVTRRLEAIGSRESERFPGECTFAEVAMREAERADAAYTVISFAQVRDRLRYLRGGSEREGVLRETLERGGVYTGRCGGRHFQEIVR
jgi:hypothetical protein